VHRRSSAGAVENRDHRVLHNSWVARQPEAITCIGDAALMGIVSNACASPMRFVRSLNSLLNNILHWLPPEAACTALDHPVN